MHIFQIYVRQHVSSINNTSIGRETLFIQDVKTRRKRVIIFKIPFPLSVAFFPVSGIRQAVIVVAEISSFPGRATKMTVPRTNNTDEPYSPVWVITNVPDKLFRKTDKSQAA